MVTVQKPVSDRWAEPDLLRFGLGPGAHCSTLPVHRNSTGQLWEIGQEEDINRDC